MKRGSFLLAALGLLAYWPVLDAHPLMDDHLFFAWLEKTPWLEALQQRFTGNWIPDFNQIQMYRPVSGLVQVAAYHLFGAHSLPQHLFSLLLHATASLLAGILAFRLSRDSRAGWCAAAILLLHPRAALGVSLIFNFHDALAGCLMLGALLFLWSLKQDVGNGTRSLKLAGLWLCTGLALGVKELAIPLIAALVLAEWLWEEVGFGWRRALFRESVPVLLLFVYLFARMKAVGHPFRTHSHPSAFPLPANAEFWALSWDLLLLACCITVAGFTYRVTKSNKPVSKQVPWIILWSGLMLLPAIHFCSQVTLRPWFFDERYWHVPLMPLSVLAGVCLTRGGWVNAGLGAAVLAITLPSWIGLVAVLTLLASGSLWFHSLPLKTQRLVAALFAIALALGTLKQSQAIRLRANEAADVHRAVASAVDKAPAGSLIAFLNFNETSVERDASFNGDLQWLLQPPFFGEDLNGRLFFSYSTWDMPPSNRFRDRTTAKMISELKKEKPVSVYRWDVASRKLEFLTTERWSSEGAVASLPLDVAVKQSSDLSSERTVWRSERLAVDPMVYRYLSIKLILPKKDSLQKWVVVLRWSSKRSVQTQEVSLDLTGTGELSSGEATAWLYPGGYSDWFLAGSINELALELPAEFGLVATKLSAVMPVEAAKQGRRIDHYRNREMKFEWVGVSSWVIER